MNMYIPPLLLGKFLDEEVRLMDWIYTIIVVLVVIWLAGLLLKIGGKFIHLILVIVLVIFLLNLFGINLF